MPFAQVNSKRLFYSWSSAECDAHKPDLTLVFIHGLGSSHSFYMTIIPHLVVCGFSCLTYDTHGSALSAYTGKQQSIKELLKDGQALLSMLQIQPKNVVVVGHSMGALVASEWAANSALAGVVLIGPINPKYISRQAFAQRIEAVVRDGMEAVASIIPAAATGSKANTTHRAFIRTLLLSQSLEGYASLCQAIVDAELPQYNQIKCALLIIAGEEDKTATLEGVNDIIHCAESTELIILPGVGHWQCIEAADKVAAAVQQFAQKLHLMLS